MIFPSIYVFPFFRVVYEWCWETENTDGLLVEKGLYWSNGNLSIRNTLVVVSRDETNLPYYRITSLNIFIIRNRLPKWCTNLLTFLIVTPYHRSSRSYFQIYLESFNRGVTSGVSNISDKNYQFTHPTNETKTSVNGSDRITKNFLKNFFHQYKHPI